MIPNSSAAVSSSEATWPGLSGISGALMSTTSTGVSLLVARSLAETTCRQSKARFVHTLWLRVSGKLTMTSHA